MSASVVCVCVSVCLSARAYLPNQTHDLYQIFCACCLWPWLGPAPAGWCNPKGQFWVFSSALTLHSGMNFATKDRFRLNLVIYHKVIQKSIPCY